MPTRYGKSTLLRMERAKRRATDIAGRIWARRNELELSCEEAALLVGVKLPTYREWEKEFGRICEKNHLKKVSQALKISEAVLKGEEEYHFDIEDIEQRIRTKPTKISSVSRPAKMLSPLQRETLGCRARDRRKQLKLSRYKLASAMEITESRLFIWEKSIPPNIKQTSIDLWEETLKAPNGWLMNPEMEAPVPTLAPEEQYITIDNALTAAEGVRKIGYWIARKRGFKTTSAAKLTKIEARTAEIFSLRYGVSGEDAITLQSIGDITGLTKERIRQIISNLTGRLQDYTICIPVIDTLIENITAYLPATVETIDQQFREQLGESLSVESLYRFAKEILGKNDIQTIDSPNGSSLAWQKMVINPSIYNKDKLRAIRRAALSMIRSSGGAQVNWVAGAATNQCGWLVTIQDVMQTCQLILGFKWLAEKDGWFWFGEETPKDNRVLHTSKKILSVAGRPLPVETIHQGLTRSRRYHYDTGSARPAMIEPPLIVVTEILKQTSWIKAVEPDSFLLTFPVPVEDVLSDSELEIFNLMHSAGGMLSRYDIKKHFQRGTFSDAMLTRNLDSSPILSRLDTGVFALRGRPINIKSIRRALKKVGEPTTSKSFERVDGRISFRLTLTDYNMRSKAIDIPSNIATYLDNAKYIINGFDTRANYSVKYRRLTGLIKKLIDIGYGVGDTVTIQIMPDEKRIVIKDQYRTTSNPAKN